MFNRIVITSKRTTFCTTFAENVPGQTLNPARIDQSSRVLSNAVSFSKVSSTEKQSASVRLSKVKKQQQCMLSIHRKCPTKLQILNTTGGNAGTFFVKIHHKLGNFWNSQNLFVCFFSITSFSLCALSVSLCVTTVYVQQISSQQNSAPHLF